jgi:phosphoadenosine phosphosulfate reductase
MVILDRLAQVCPGLRVITVDTDFLFAETYALMEEIERRYHIHLEVHKSPLTPNIQAQVYHPNLWEVNPDQCCHIRKVLPLAGALEGLDAWISGLRRDQSNTRADLDLVAWNPKYNLVKINPLTYWTRGQMWSYILENKVPYNPLHDQGYASIGCTHCTHPTTNLGDERSGRWRGRQKTECGIHL